VAALEDFEDSIGSDSKVKVKAGETRIVPSSILLKAKKVPAPIKEHSYELRMEKKVKQMVDEEEKHEKG